MGAPQPKTNEIAEQMNLELSKPCSDGFTLKRLEREIRILLNSPDPEVRGHALVLRGALAALDFDPDTARQWYEKALDASGHAPDIYETYVEMLMSIGMVRKALEVIEMGLEKNPRSQTLFQQAIRAAASTFQFDRLDSYSARLRELEPSEDSPEILRMRKSAKWQRKMLEQAGADSEALLRRFEAAHLTALKHRTRVREQRVSVSSRGALVEWTVGCDDAEIALMNFDVALALAEFQPDPCESLMAFGFTSIDTIDVLDDEMQVA